MKYNVGGAAERAFRLFPSQSQPREQSTMARKLADGGKVSKASKRKEKKELKGDYSQKAIRQREAIIENRRSKQEQAPPPADPAPLPPYGAWEFSFR